ncbi:hypothetical protein ACFLXB_04040 [Chloroflexota bacterium]
MKDYSKEIMLGSLLTLFFGVLVVWYAIQEPDLILPVILAVAIFLIGMVTFFSKAIARRKDLVSGVPAEDEFTQQAKLHAGNRAFHASMLLWLLIFIFQTSFSKTQEMLGVGVLGSAAIYGLFLWYFRSTGKFNEE